MIDLDAWKPRLADLVDTLLEGGHLCSTPWVEAFADTPRHLFVPRIIATTPEGYHRLSAEERPEEWLSAVYSDDSLVTQDKPHAAGYRLPGGQLLRVPTSSSTMPSLMARMLEALDVSDGMRVLEIGTGTGYNAALLAHRLGSANVVSIDIDPGLVETARERIAGLGHHPTLLVGDGAAGADQHGPFDRIIATAAVPEIPVAWIDQLTPGGMILANLRGELAGGYLCLLTKHSAAAEVIGPILPVGGHFMWLRTELDDPHRPHEHTTEPGRAASRTTTSSDPANVPVDEERYRFLLQLQLPGARSLYRGHACNPAARDEQPAIIATTADGSRAEAFTIPEPRGGHRIVQTGPRRIWDTVEASLRLFHDLGRPDPGAFGVVANRSTQFMWLGHDDSWHRWPLPLV